MPLVKENIPVFSSTPIRKVAKKNPSTVIQDAFVTTHDGWLDNWNPRAFS